MAEELTYDVFLSRGPNNIPLRFDRAASELPSSNNSGFNVTKKVRCEGFLQPRPPLVEIGVAGEAEAGNTFWCIS